MIFFKFEYNLKMLCILCNSTDPNVKNFSGRFRDCVCSECCFHQQCYLDYRKKFSMCPICKAPHSGTCVIPKKVFIFFCLLGLALEMVSVGSAVAVLSMQIDSPTTIGMSIGVLIMAVLHLLFLTCFAINCECFALVAHRMGTILDIMYGSLCMFWTIMFWGKDQGVTETAKIGGMIAFIRVTTVIVLTQPVNLFLITCADEPVTVRVRD